MQSRFDVQKVRLELIRLIDRACIARGEAQWTHGYRTGRYALKADDEQEPVLYEKEKRQFAHCELAERSAHRAISKLIRAVRAERTR